LSPLSRDVNILSKRCEELAIESCRYVEKILIRAISKHKKVIFITHIPPYEKATWHMGKISEQAFLPWFSSKVMGETINKIMVKNPDKELLVLCGHTHSGGEHKPIPNIKVITGKADYYFPDIQDLISL
jgi:Icc-related predicted phosphoesterase